MLTGQNGILNRAGEAKEETERSQQEELEKLAGMEALTNINGYEYEDKKTNKKVNIPAGYLVSTKEGENSLEDGLVIKDASGNEFVWVEVPKTQVNYGITNETLTETDYGTIETKLKAYAAPYTSSSNTDEWYDYYTGTYDGVSQYIKIIGIPYSSAFSKAKEYYGAIYTDEGLTQEATAYASGTTYYAKIENNLNHKDGCGLTYEEYKRNKEKMLKSIYEKEGFWISRYEIGDEEGTKNNYTIRTIGDLNNNVQPNQTPVSKPNQVPYIYVTCSQAQNLASQMAPKGSTVTSSLLFGIQWDLVCKYLEVKLGDNVIVNGKNIINQDSSTWGNLANSEIKLNRGKYKSNFSKWFEYNKETDYVKSQKKVKNKSILLTTGASDDAKKQNIYDLAGNLSEWTLEKYSDAFPYEPCAHRSGDYSINNYSASVRLYYGTREVREYIGCRAALY